MLEDLNSMPSILRCRRKGEAHQTLYLEVDGD